MQPQLQGAYPMAMRTKPMMGRDTGHDSVLWRLRLGDEIARLRITKGLTQKEVTDAVGLENHQFMSGIERGTKTVPPERLSDFADVLGVDRMEFAKLVLRHTNPWMYVALFGAEGDRELIAEIKRIPDRVNRRRGPRA